MNQTISRLPLAIALGMMLTLLTACGGGGGGGGSTPVPPPPPPGSSTTHSVAITALELDDTRFGDPIAITGLPLNGATVTVD